MATYSSTNVGLRIISLLVLVAVLALGGLLWFDYLGILDAKRAVQPVRSLLGLSAQPDPVEAADPLLLDRERLDAQLEALALQQEELNRRESTIRDGERQVTQQLAELEERATALDAREKLFNQRVNAFDNRTANLEQNARYLVSMPPADAVEILQNLDDQDVIDLLRMTDQIAEAENTVSIVPFWLSQLPADRAAVLTRKMARRATE